MSLWTISRSWRAFNPLTVWITKCHTYFSVNFLLIFLYFSIICSKSPLSAISMMIHRDPETPSKNASLYPITFGCWILAKILTSFKALYFSLSVSCPILTFFMAYKAPSDFRLTWSTSENAPSPSFLMTWKSVILLISFSYRCWISLTKILVTFWI